MDVKEPPLTSAYEQYKQIQLQQLSRAQSDFQFLENQRNARLDLQRIRNNKDAFYQYYDGKTHYENLNESSYNSLIRIDEYMDNQEAVLKKQKEE